MDPLDQSDGWLTRCLLPSVTNSHGCVQSLDQEETGVSVFPSVTNSDGCVQSLEHEETGVSVLPSVTNYDGCVQSLDQEETGVSVPKDSIFTMSEPIVVSGKLEETVMEFQLPSQEEIDNFHDTFNEEALNM